MPLAVVRRRSEEPTSDATQGGVDDRLRQQQVLEVDEGQGDQSGVKNQESTEVHVGAESPRRQRKEDARAQLDQRVAKRDGGATLTTSTSQDDP